MVRRRGRVAVAIVTAALALAPVPAAGEPVRDAVFEQLAQRLFPLLTASAGNMAPLTQRDDLDAALRARGARRAACGADPACLAQALLWTDAEATALARALPQSASAADDGAAAQARREIDGINVVLRTYALGQVPRYPQIDGAGTIDPAELRARVQAAAWLAATPPTAGPATLDPSIDFALALLDGSDRTDAIGFEPLLKGANEAAVARARTLEWSRYRYSAMIVTGVGPEVPDMRLSPYGKYHLRLAADRFAAGDVPIIIVTGGRAHPRATPFTEAEQMRRALIDRYGVPAEAIMIEPYARHTTTNLRNAVRLLMAVGAPLAKDTLIVCNPSQSASIASPRFVERNAEELGYQPGTAGRRLSATELEFRPSPQSARIDPRDPLDP